MCQYLGFLGAEEILSAADVGEGQGPIWLDDVNCEGNEYSPFHCRHNKLGRHNCDHSEDVGVRCISKSIINYAHIYLILICIHAYQIAEIITCGWYIKVVIVIN